MQKLKSLNLYIERAHAGNKGKPPDCMNELESIHDHMNVLSFEEAQYIYIYDYMNREEFIDLEYVSPMPDPLDRTIRLRALTMSDGVYSWAYLVAHWVKTYRIRLPKAFMEWVHMTPEQRHQYPSIPINEVNKHRNDCERIFIQKGIDF